MSDGYVINEALRREIDQIWARLGDATHYQVLGLEPGASRQAIHEARAAIIRKLTVPPGTLPRAYTPRINVILRAVELAFSALSDPVQRLNYDRSLPRGSVVPTRASHAMGERGSAVPPQRPSRVGGDGSSAAPPEPFARAERVPEPYGHGLDVWEKTPLPRQLSRAERAQEVYSQGLNPWEKTPLPQSVMPGYQMKKTPPPGTLQAVAPIAPVGERQAAVVPPPLKRTAEMPSPFGPPMSDSAVPGQALGERPTANPLRATMTGVFAEPSKLHADFDVLLQEFDRLTASVQLCVSHLAEVEGPRRAQFHGTFHALTATRGMLASMMATREEAAGHWEAASKLWARAAKAKPTDPSLAVRAAAAAQRAGNDPSAAALLTHHANETSPEHASAVPPQRTLAR